MIIDKSMIVEVVPTVELLSYHLNMFLYNDLSPLIPLVSLEMGPDTKIMWQVGGLELFSNHLSTIEGFDLFLFLEDLESAFRTCEEYLLNPQSLKLDLRACYVNKDNHYCFMYMPMKVPIDGFHQSNLLKLLNQIQPLLNEEDDGSMMKLHQLRLILEKNNITFEEIYEVLKVSHIGDLP